MVEMQTISEWSKSAVQGLPFSNARYEASSSQRCCGSIDAASVIPLSIGIVFWITVGESFYTYRWT